MSLVPDYKTSSDSEEEENEEFVVPEPNKSNPPEIKPKLPPPSFKNDSNDKEKLVNSVFKNPFIEEETEKEALLQKHVKMVESKDQVVTINGKKICWNYRKGRCRFGRNCKFAHDSDIQKPKELSSDPVKNDVTEKEIKQDAKTRQKRKRPGLSQTLIPGKKVLKNYQKQKM